MSNHTVSAAGGAMPAEAHKTRRAALALFGVATTLMLPIAAVASPTSTARLADLIAVHRVAQDAAVDAEASELTEPTDVRVFFSAERNARSASARSASG